MEVLINEIDNYIKYLIHQCNLQISLHPQFHDNVILDSKLRIYNIHRNSYCVFLKNVNGVQNECLRSQKKAFKKCQNGSFCGTCYAGVLEYVYPVFSKDSAAGFISVSGYVSPNPEPYFKKLYDEFGIPPALSEEHYLTLSMHLPEKSFIDTLINPLQRMLELAYLKSSSIIKPTTFYEKVLLYLKEHHRESLTSEDICEHFSCSRSYLSHQFKKNCGLSIREYINRLRVEDAKSLLIHSRLNITEISIVVGFNDSNYFSMIFKKMTGISPAQYRKEHS